MNAEAIKNLGAVNDTLPMDVSMFGVATFFAKVNGAVAGHNVTFQYSLDSTNGVDGTWLSLPCTRIATAPAVESTSGVLAATPTYAWRANVCGIPWVRVLTSAHTSGSMTWQITATAEAGTEPTVVSSSSGTSTVSGVAAHDAAISGNPVRVAGRGRTANYAITSQDDTVDAAATLMGAMVIKENAPYGAQWRYAGTLTTTADTAMKAAAGASVYNAITDLILQNTNATATTVIIKDGTTAIGTVSLPASMTLPLVLSFNTPLLSSGNAALNIACGTTGANVLVTASGFSGA